MFSWIADRYQDQIVDPGKQPIFLLLVGLVGSFVFIRVSTRMIRAKVRWWPGNVSAGGTHLHHELFGVVVMLAAGVLGFAVRTVTPWRELLALLFGIGAGLVLDEFALLLHLQDVYWTEEGRASIDAVIVGTIATLMIVVGTLPFGLGGMSSAEMSARWTTVAVVAVNLALTIVTMLKGKPWTGLLSVAVPLLGLVGATRLARPASPWARWRYTGHPAHRERAARRQERYERTWARRKRKLWDLIGGVPSEPSAP